MKSVCLIATILVAVMAIIAASGTFLRQTITKTVMIVATEDNSSSGDEETEFA